MTIGKTQLKARELHVFPLSVFNQVAMGFVHVVTAPLILPGLTEVVLLII